MIQLNNRKFLIAKVRGMMIFRSKFCGEGYFRKCSSNPITEKDIRQHEVIC